MYVINVQGLVTGGANSVFQGRKVLNIIPMKFDKDGMEAFKPEIFYGGTSSIRIANPKIVGDADAQGLENFFENQFFFGVPNTRWLAAPRLPFAKSKMRVILPYRAGKKEIYESATQLAETVRYYAMLRRDEQRQPRFRVYPDTTYEKEEATLAEEGLYNAETDTLIRAMNILVCDFRVP